MQVSIVTSSQQQHNYARTIKKWMDFACHHNYLGFRVHGRVRFIVLLWIEVVCSAVEEQHFERAGTV